jgi:hypothetical protein
MRYSPELIKKCHDYFKDLDGKDTPEEEVEEYLDSLADLYICFSKSIKQRNSPVKPSQANH